MAQEDIPLGPRLRILLTDDNDVNQAVARQMLVKGGHEVALAGNGKAALAALDREAFDLVFMDVQMPIMDGFEALAHIRRRDGKAGRHQPVVAMTAHALPGDRERCLVAGFDDYVAKPIHARDLAAVLERLGLAEAGRPAAAEEPPAPEASDLVDREAALRRVGGNHELLRTIAGMFRNDCPKLLNELRAGLAAADPQRVFRAAHTLKGAVSYFGAAPVFAAAQTLEAMGRTGDLAGSREALRTLEALAGSLLPALDELTLEPVSP